MDKKYFDLAYEEAQKAFDLEEVPVGCIIVKDNRVLASAHNMKETDCCVTSHAEILAIQEASKKINNWRLEDCDLYVTLDPCPMCASAIKQSRIKNVYSALNNSDQDNLFIISKIFNLNDSTNSMVYFDTNLSVEKSKLLLNKFFKNQRNK